VTDCPVRLEEYLLYIAPATPGTRSMVVIM